MTIASIFKNGRNQAVRLPKELEFQGVTEVDVRREGNSIILSPVRKSWASFALQPELGNEEAAHDFLLVRQDVIEAGRVDFE